MRGCLRAGVRQTLSGIDRAGRDSSDGRVFSVRREGAAIVNKSIKVALLTTVSLIFSLVIANVALWILKLCDPPIYFRDPALGYLAVPDQWPSSRGIPYRINQAGLRGPDFPVVKPPGTFRIVFIGDSVTFGGGVVSDADTYVAQVGALIAHRLNRTVDTINISAPGWGVENMKAYVERYGLYGADLVVWVLPYEDLRRPKNDGGGMPTSRSFRLAFLVSHTLQIARSRLREAEDRVPEAPDSSVLPGNLKSFGQTLDLINRAGAKALVVFFPMGAVAADADEAAYRAYQEVAGAHRIPTCDVCSAMIAAGGEALFYDGAHLNSRGEHVAGPLIAQCVIEKLPSLETAAAGPAGYFAFIGPASKSNSSIH